MPENNQILSVEGQLIGMPLAGPESFSQQQLDYLKRALGVDETVLWSGDFKYGDSAITLSETIANFEFIEVTLKKSYQLYRRQAENGSFVLINGIPSNDAKAKVAYTTLNASGSSVTYTLNRVMQGDSSYSNVSDDETHIIKVVGIHRISGGN